jgi:hypothetical protein
VKKRLAIIAIFCLLITTAVFFGLWQSEKNNLSDVRQLAQISAASALDKFEEYRITNDESDYWYAVAEFRLFEQTYHRLVEQTTNKDGNYLFCNEVYGYLVLYPERSQSHINEIIDVMTILADNVTDDNGYLRMSDLRNTIQE